MKILFNSSKWSKRSIIIGVFWIKETCKVWIYSDKCIFDTNKMYAVEFPIKCLFSILIQKTDIESKDIKIGIKMWWGHFSNVEL